MLCVTMVTDSQKAGTGFLHVQRYSERVSDVFARTSNVIVKPLRVSGRPSAVY
jgi:hypothetical protein